VTELLCGEATHRETCPNKRINKWTSNMLLCSRCKITETRMESVEELIRKGTSVDVVRRDVHCTVKWQE
jgi:hypothetical protein